MYLPLFKNQELLRRTFNWFPPFILSSYAFFVVVKRKDDLEKFHFLPKAQMTKSASYAKAINIFTMSG